MKENRDIKNKLLTYHSIWKFVVIFLPLEDFVKFGRICKIFREIYKSNHQAWYGLTIKHLVGNLDLFEEISHNMMLIQGKPQHLSNYHSSFKCVNCLINCAFPKLYDSEINQAPQLIIKFIFEVFKDPPIPCIKMIKDESNSYKQTLCQDHFYELIFQECSLPYKVMHGPAPAFSTELKGLINMKSTFISQINKSHSEEELLSIRWYDMNFANLNYFSDFLSTEFGISNSISKNILETVNAFSEIYKGNLDNYKNKSSFITLFLHLNEIFKAFCILNLRLIKSSGNGFSIIFEYLKRWNGYIAMAIEIDEKLSPLSNLLNQIYEEINPTFPRYPKFSFFRLSIKFWINYVFEQIEQNLLKEYILAFKQIINQPRCTGKKMMQNQKEYKNISCVSPQSSDIISNDTDITISEIDSSVIGNFAHAIIDLSINDITIHQLGHTRFNMENPYSKFHTKIIKTYLDFFLKGLDMKKPNEISKFALSELKFLHNLFPPVTFSVIRSKVLGLSYESIHLQTKNIFNSFYDKSEEDLVTYSSYGYLNDYSTMTSYFGKYISELCNYRSIHSKEAFRFAEFVKTSLPNLPGDFNLIVEELNKDIYEINDLEIDLLLKKRNIPFELSDYEKTFYSLSSNIKMQSLKQYEINENNANTENNDQESESMIFDDEFDEMEMGGGLQLKRA